MHGGKTPQGIALPQTKHGRYSKHLPTRLLANYEAAKSDPDLLVMHDEIALVDARINELLEGSDTATAAQQAWPEIQTLIEQRRRLVESERKRLVELHQVVSADQAMLMVRSLIASVREHVSDPAILRAISAELERFSMARAD